MLGIWNDLFFSLSFGQMLVRHQYTVCSAKRIEQIAVAVNKSMISSSRSVKSELEKNNRPEFALSSTQVELAVYSANVPLLCWVTRVLVFMQVELVIVVHQLL